MLSQFILTMVRHTLPGYIMEEGVALVTAGQSWIGHHIILELQARGYRIVSSYRSDHRTAKDMSRELRIPLYKADLTIEEEVCTLFDRIEADHGNVDVLINNASSFHVGKLLEIDGNELKEAIDGCIYTTMLPILRAVPVMMGSNYGRVVNLGIAGVDQIKGYVEVGAHAAAKTAIAVLTKSLARELTGSGVTINMVAPGIVDNPSKGDDWRRKMMSKHIGNKLVDPGAVARAVADSIENPSLNGEILDVI